MFQLRRFAPVDAEPCWRLFRDTVHRVNKADYRRDQLDAWAPAAVDLEAWATRFQDRFAYVACIDAQIVGFSDMTTSGHLDRLFVSADHQRCGIARALVERLVADAQKLELESITTDASITAKPFFERMHFRVLQAQQVECRGVSIPNYQMLCHLPSQSIHS
ncbi:GNAT family N-acetyltransferase [Allorhodopirellula solitaria]|uniref:Putative N-acetyltransferase YafP n=1 Tax=Allorhodopirellula solitaria TaxID=2527987 RepID=A0A5C5WNF1_9BACT|nr:GNAT family N-acetyltransferase [Allorhodopirellula solitaria]TWT52354.1 putative N-acetyltransferase YafP [Allorhodopirellula solitaria]